MNSFDPTHFINRELSWLEFNQRVLDEALSESTPLLERVKFLAISSSNLDEFFEVRVAALKQQMESDIVERNLDGHTATETFRAVEKRTRRFVDLQYHLWTNTLTPLLRQQGFRFHSISSLSAQDRAWIEDFYLNQVRKVLTPLGLDPAHPFPELRNKSLNFIIQLELLAQPTRTRLAVVQVPSNFPRLVQLPRPIHSTDYVFLEDLIGHHLANLFPGTRIHGYWFFRLTRNSELYIDEEEVSNLLKAVENELHNRLRGEAVRLELTLGCPPEIQNHLLETLRLTTNDLYPIDGPLNLCPLISLLEGDHSPELRDPAFVAPFPPPLSRGTNLFEIIRHQDVLLHTPYYHFQSVVEFLEQAAQDPKVLAIKQTLYRTGGDSRIVKNLIDAARAGKQVTVVVELKARFDEANNILWARRLEEAGVHVVYGLVGYKIHGKICLVVRNDDDGLRRYIHLSTGNYNPTTSKLYTDLGLFTANPEFGEDATNLFNLLTGICQFTGMNRFLVAPFELHTKMIEFIDREALHASRGLPARIIAQMNALVDPHIIEALYRASQAGVQIDLIVRGICCLRPQLKGISDNIRVFSIIDRFLEHRRVFYFENSCQPQIYIGSADWMPRNFFRRIEIVFPIVDGRIRDYIMNSILSVALADPVKARVMKADGSYSLPPTPSNNGAVSSQNQFIQAALKPTKLSSKGRSKSKSHYPTVEVQKSPPTVSNGCPK